MQTPPNPLLFWPFSNLGLYADAIEADMTRLTALIPCWPPSFPSLNAARDHVAGVSRAKCFSYTYWPDLEPYRFRMFVNFNTAKQAFRKRAFCVVEEERVAEARADWAAAVRTSEEYEKSDGEVTDTEHVTSESEEQGCTAVIAAAVEDEPTQMLDYDTDRDSDAASISPFDELEVRLQRVEEQVGHVPKGREDPFKVSKKTIISFAQENWKTCTDLVCPVEKEFTCSSYSGVYAQGCFWLGKGVGMGKGG